MEKAKVVIHRKKLQGIITKFSSVNTIKVEVETKAMHPKYQKVIKSHKEYLVQCLDKKDLAVGDIVLIEEGKPISKSKCFYFVKKI